MMNANQCFLGYDKKEKSGFKIFMIHGGHCKKQKCMLEDQILD